VTGGYFADPGLKDVPALARLGFPFADVSADGEVMIGKVAEAGGRVDVATRGVGRASLTACPVARRVPFCPSIRSLAER
jgi:hypothetical protein